MRNAPLLTPRDVACASGKCCKVAIEGNASGTGIFTIVGPNTNTNYTITLPQETGTLVTTGVTTGLNASALSTGTVATARLASGTANNTTFLRGDQTWAVGTSGPPGPPGPTGPTGPSGTPSTTFNTVGSYCYIGMYLPGGGSASSGGTYPPGTNAGQLQSVSFNYGGCGVNYNFSNNLSGTWRWMGAPASQPTYGISFPTGVIVRTA